MTDEGVLCVVDGAVALVTIDRPAKLNSVTQEMSDRLVEVIEALNDDDAVRVVILTGAGERSFCAGSDIRTLDKYATPWDFRNRTDYCDAIRACRKPVIAAVNGYAFGGGLETALSCDIRLASEAATFAAPEITLGWIGGGGMSAFLAASIGPSNAAVMLMTGQPIDAATALRWGLVSEVTEPGELLPRARALAEVIASPAADRRRDRQGQPARGGEHAAGGRDPLRARPADGDVRDRGRPRGSRGVRREATRRLPPPLTMTSRRRDEERMTRLHTTDIHSLLPDDGTTGVLVGRAWDPTVGGPSVVAIRAEGVVDLSASFATMRAVTETPEPAAAVAAASGPLLGIASLTCSRTPHLTRAMPGGHGCSRPSICRWSKPRG